MSDQDPIAFRPRPVPAAAVSPAGRYVNGTSQSTSSQTVTFNRQELSQILNLYGRKVAAGEWRDYAMDFGPDKAVFSIFRRTSECPLYTIEKTPRLARKQGAYSVVAASGLIMKRGHDLRLALEVLDRRVKLLQH